MSHQDLEDQGTKASPSLGTCSQTCVHQAAQGSAACVSLSPGWPPGRPLRACRAAWSLGRRGSAAPGSPGGRGPARASSLSICRSWEAIQKKCQRRVRVTSLWPAQHFCGLQVADSGDQPREQHPGTSLDKHGGPLDGARSFSTRSAAVPWASPCPTKPQGRASGRGDPGCRLQVSSRAPALSRSGWIIPRHKLSLHFTPG